MDYPSPELELESRSLATLYIVRILEYRNAVPRLVLKYCGRYSYTWTRLARLPVGLLGFDFYSATAVECPQFTGLSFYLGPCVGLWTLFFLFFRKFICQLA